MNENKFFPGLRKSIANFVKDENGTMLRAKAAVVGPIATGAIILMSNETTVDATETPARHQSHASHVSHVSHSSHHSHYNSGDPITYDETDPGGSGDAGSTTNHDTKPEYDYAHPSHSSHSSGSSSGFSHNAGTLIKEMRHDDNN